MSTQPAYDYTPPEVRGALKWQMQQKGTSAEVIDAALEGFTDKVIEQSALANAEFNENCQMLAVQYREAKCRGQIS